MCYLGTQQAERRKISFSILYKMPSLIPTNEPYKMLGDFNACSSVLVLEKNMISGGMREDFLDMVI